MTIREGVIIILLAIGGVALQTAAPANLKTEAAYAAGMVLGGFIWSRGCQGES